MYCPWFDPSHFEKKLSPDVCVCVCIVVTAILSSATVNMTSLNNSKRSPKAGCVREHCKCSPSYGWGRQVRGAWSGGRHICFIFTRGENESFRAGKFCCRGGGEGGALGMMKLLNLLFPCNQFVSARLNHY